MFRTDSYHIIIHSPNKVSNRKVRFFSKNLAGDRFPVSSERPIICINLFQSPCMREEFFSGLNTFKSEHGAAQQTYSKAKLMVWEELETDFPLTSLSQLWQETTTSLLFRCLMQSEQSIIKNNDSGYVTQTKIQWYAILCSPQALSICCCQLCSSAVQVYNFSYEI